VKQRRNNIASARLPKIFLRALDNIPFVDIITLTMKDVPSSNKNGHAKCG
jgi:hypothetical protein